LYTHARLPTPRETDSLAQPSRPAIGRAERGARSLSDRPTSGLSILIVILLAGLLVRVVVAALIVPGSGFRVDVGDFAAWARELASTGPGGFYRPGYFVDYPPAYLYVLWAVGLIAQWWGELTGNVTVLTGMVKAPGILADAAVAAMLFFITRRWFDVRGGAVAAAIFLFNPGTMFDSAVWGQMDSVGTLVLLAAVYTLARGWTEAAAVLSVVATLVKFQYGFFMPIVLAVGLKRHLFGRSSDAAHDGRPDPLRLLTSLSSGVVTLVALLAPFGLQLFAPLDPVHSLWHRFREAADTYTGLTLNAFNLWMNPVSGLGGTGFWGDDRLPVWTVGSLVLTWWHVGTLLFLVVGAIGVWALWRRDDAPAILFVTLLLAVAFFALLTRMHERYLFPALAFAAPFALLGWGWRAAYGVLAASFFFDVYFTYTIPYFENPGVGGAPMTLDPLLGATILSAPGIYLLSFAVVALVFVMSMAAWRLDRLPWGLVSPSRFVRGAVASRATVPVAVPAAVTPAPAEGGAVALAPAASATREPALERLRAWLRPVRRRSEPAVPSRLGAGDVVLFASITVLALMFRLWRLDTPVSMHFDEVYHARSATEWLANWEFGADQDVYEWTHPMMAKYLIAAGIVLADPNRVVGVRETDEAPSLMAVAPERALSARDRSLLFTAGDDRGLLVRDAETLEELARWELPERPASLAFDDEHDRLLVGSADSGTVVSYPIAWTSGASQATTPRPTSEVDTGLADVLEIEEPATSSRQVTVRGSDGLAVIDADAGTVLASSDLEVAGMALVDDVGETHAGLAVADPAASELAFLDPATLEPISVDITTDACPERYEEVETQVCERSPVDLPAAPLGPMTTQGSGDDQSVWVLLAESPDADEAGAMTVVRPTQTHEQITVPLPGEPHDIVWNRVTNIVHIAGSDRVWTVEPHGEERSGGEHDPDFAGYAVFDETRLDGRPVALALDASRHEPSEDHERLIVATESGGTGRLVHVDVGSNAFAWRIAGIVFGALLAGLVYLVGATMFARRRIAVLAGVFVAFDAMSFAQSRISMNDVFVAVFIVAAYLLMWQIWSGRWRGSAWWALPVVGILIGLAAGTKWVGFYALAGLWVLVLARSDLGRLVLLAGGTFLLVVAGIGAPWPFTLVLVGMIALLGLIAWARPVHVGWDDLRALPSTGLVIGAIGFAFALTAGDLTRDDPVGIVSQLLARGAEAVWPAALMLALAAVLLVWRAVVSRRDPAGDGRWYLPDQMGGFGWAWVGACLFVLPLVVYTLTYLPYLQLGHAFATPALGPGYGWSLEEMQVQMFTYHFGLQSGHPASSPWWSWPLSLRPVWFYQGNFDGDLIAVVYNGGNLVLFWLGVPAVIYCAVQAWRRQSLALLLVALAFAMQWLPWTRIERATFLYHYFTALPFFMLALAYLADDALRRRSTYGIAIGVGAAAILIGLLLYPINGALPMPSWYVHAFQALPPWNFSAQFPDPPQGQRELISAGGLLRLVLATGAAALAATLAVYGRDLRRRFTPPSPPAGPSQPIPESG
jgi:predicted membrane-bound dolichyl-phosphate-mannose-protein mannosyltransferase